MIVNILLQLATLLFGVAKGVVSLTLLARQGHDFYGLMSQFLVTATFLGSVLSLQLDAATVRFAAGDRGALPRILSSNLLCVAGVGLIAVGLMLLLGDRVSPLVFGSPGLGGPMALAALSSLLTALLLVAYSALQAHSRFRRLALFQVSQYLLQIVAIAVSAGSGLELRVMSALVLCDALVLLVLLVFLARDVGFGRPAEAYLRRACGFALPLLVSFFLTWLIHASGRFVLVNLDGVRAVAPYAATFTIAALTGLLTPPFVNVLYPRVAKQTPEEAAPLLGRALGVYAILSTALLVGMVSLGRDLVELASGPGFYAGPTVMAGVGLGFLFTGVTRLVGLPLMSGDRTRVTMQCLAAGAAVNLAVAAAGATRFGAEAIALGYALGFLVPLLLMLRRLGPAAVGLRWGAVLSGAVRLAPALAGLALTLAWIPRRGLGGLMLCALGGGAVFLLLVFALRLIDHRAAARAAQLVRGRFRRGPAA